MLVFKRSDTWCIMEPDGSPGNVPMPSEDEHYAHIDLPLTDNVTLTPWWNGGTDPVEVPAPDDVPDFEAHPGSDGVAGGVVIKIGF